MHACVVFGPSTYFPGHAKNELSVLLYGLGHFFLSPKKTVMKI